MTHFSTKQADFQYYVVGRHVCDKLTGEILSDFDRSAIDWSGSLEYTHSEELYSFYRSLYPDFPDFVPGWWLDEASRVARFRADVRSTEGACSLGLSTSNKVCRIKNLSTGETIEIDKVASRLSRMRRRVFAWAETIKPSNDAYDKIMITLTYAGVDDWRPGHIRSFMLGVRSELGSSLFGYAWCAELQQRGAVHYHVILVVRKGCRLEMPDKSGLWPFGMSKIEKARTVFYICSYMKKTYQKEGVFPRGLRMFAVWISPSIITNLERWLFRLSSIPRWLSEKIVGMGNSVHGLPWRRAVGGGWWFADQFFRSPFVFCGFV